MRRVVVLLRSSQMKARSNGSLWVLLVLALLFYSAMAAEADVIPGLTGTFFQFDFSPPPDFLLPMFIPPTGPPPQGEGSFGFAVNSPWSITGVFGSNNQFTTGGYPCFTSNILPCDSTFGGSITSLIMTADNGTQKLQFVGTVTGTVSGGEFRDSIEYSASEEDKFSFFGRWSNGWYTIGQYDGTTQVPPLAAGTLTITTATTPVPEPSTVAVLAPGLLTVGALRHRRRRHPQDA